MGVIPGLSVEEVATQLSKKWDDIDAAEFCARLMLMCRRVIPGDDPTICEEEHWTVSVEVGSAE